METQPLSNPQTIVQRIINRQATFQATKLGKGLSDLSDTVRDISAEVEKKSPSYAAKKLSDSITSALDSAADYLSTTSGEDILSDVSTFSRERPLAAAALAAGCGFLAVRLGRVSSLRAGS
jgi:hypothetical protein